MTFNWGKFLTLVIGVPVLMAYLFCVLGVIMAVTQRRDPIWGFVIIFVMIVLPVALLVGFAP